jgi:hypothetical protein
MSTIINGSTNAITFPDATIQTTAALTSGGSLTSATITALNTSGITFPATQVPSANANTLDDYEEGTWTPAISASSVSYTLRTGTYTKIGNLVWIHCFVQISAITSPTGGAGAAFITGLPFTSAASGSSYYPSFTTAWNGSNWGGSIGVAQVIPSSTNISGVGCTNNSAFSDSSPADIWDASNNWVKISGCYIAA